TWIFLKDEPSKKQEMINAIRTALGSLGDDETATTASAYDTALVALVKNLDGDEKPQFPSCIDWIVQNQLPDGSWGDPAFFMVQDRMISTLACVVAVKSWNIDCDDLCDRGKPITGFFFVLVNLGILTYRFSSSV
uniref:Squalene cyclase N-terminal domain-containing protein n=1 Tax=Aegilops tauschii subsp. strangulata TaxID=200361 RepID=A0A453DBE3_AEGTS